MALFVLGAGATRGASFVNPRSKPCLPPLDADFFTQLQRVRNPKHQGLIDQVLTDVVELFGHNFDASLETVFATLEHTIRMLRATKPKGVLKVSVLEAKRDRLLQTIAMVLEDSLCKMGNDGSSSRDTESCDYHSRLVRDVLRGRDDVISFNYDCTIDFALRHAGVGKWNARYGYGFNLGPGGSRLEGDAHWMPEKPASQNGTVRLLKLHGSLHFQISGSRVTLKQRPYTRQHGDLRFSIIPPESNKAYDAGPFASLWKSAATAVSRAKQVVLIGYSLPQTDMHSTALFRTSVKKGKLESLVVVNPDRTARRRTRSVFQAGMQPSTRVLSFDCLPEFLAADQGIWR